MKTLRTLMTVIPALLLVACTNNNLERAIQKFTSGIPNTSGSGDIITVTSVVISNADSGALEIIGNGNQIGGNCVSSSSDTNFGPSSCACVYEYSGSGGETIIEQVDTAYIESNLVRCSSATLEAANVNTVQVSIKVIPLDLSSNSITVNLSGTGNTLDLSESASFMEAQRIQCRDLVYIPSIFCDHEECVYDPIQSEDNRFSYPINFYNTNIGRGPLAMVERSSQQSQAAFFSKWDCSFDPESPKNFENKRIYSVGADTSGNKLIFPATSGSFDRSTFYLAKKRTGVFNIAINAFMAPGILTQSPDAQGLQPDGTEAPIGWGARPITTSAGEECPETATEIPAGFKWVKVWAFKGDLPPRRYISGAQQAFDHGQIACNPADFSSPAVDVFTDCNNEGQLDSVSSNTDLANRVFLGTGACVEFPNNTHGGASPPYVTNEQAGQTSNIANYSSNYQDGTDIFEEVYDGGGGQDPAVPWNLEGQPGDDNGDDVFDAGDQGAPWSNTLFLGDLDSAQSRADYLFVVSPTEITFDTMNNKLAGHEPYYPYTFRRSDDCSAPDPDADNTCQANADKRVFFDLFSAEISNDPDTTSSGNTYPICALQPL